MLDWSSPISNKLAGPCITY